MQPHGVDILLVEDNANDAELTLRALKQHNLANQVHVCLTAPKPWTSFRGAPAPAEPPPTNTF